MGKLRWQDMVSLVLGVAIAVTPWVLGLNDRHPVATWNATIAGIAIVILTAIDLETPATWEEWVLGALGLWLVIAPWALGYASVVNFMAVSVAVGALVLVLAAWTLHQAGAWQRHRGPAH